MHSDDPAAAELVIALYTEAERGWPYLGTLIERAFKQERPLPAARAWVSETLKDMVRFRRRIALVLGKSDARNILAGALALRGEAGGLSAGEVGALIDLEERLAPIDTAAKLASVASLPDWLAELWWSELGAERALSLAKALNQRPPQTLRVNPQRVTRDALLESLRSGGIAAEPTRWSPLGVTLTRPTDVFSLPEFHAGAFEVQDEASQLVACVVAPPPGGVVIDACAGAGGKTLAIGGLLGGKGRVIALDPKEAKLEELRRRARRASLGNIQALCADATRPPRLPPADRVLVDAPCSGLGVLRRNPEARWRLGPQDLAGFPLAQLAIARAAVGYLAPRGRLIYATCSFLRAENEAIIDALVTEHPELERVRVREVLGRAGSESLTDAGGFTLRTWPDRHGMDGFFAAVVRKKG